MIPAVVSICCSSFSNSQTFWTVCESTFCPAFLLLVLSFLLFQGIAESQSSQAAQYYWACFQPACICQRGKTLFIVILDHKIDCSSTTLGYVPHFQKHVEENGEALEQMLDELVSVHFMFSWTLLTYVAFPCRADRSHYISSLLCQLCNCSLPCCGLQNVWRNCMVDFEEVSLRQY